MYCDNWICYNFRLPKYYDNVVCVAENFTWGISNFLTQADPACAFKIFDLIWAAMIRVIWLADKRAFCYQIALQISRFPGTQNIFFGNILVLSVSCVHLAYVRRVVSFFADYLQQYSTRIAFYCKLAWVMSLPQCILPNLLRFMMVSQKLYTVAKFGW